MRHRRRFAAVALPAGLLVLLLALALRLPIIVQQNPLEAAWQRAQQAGNYAFQAEIEQRNTPSASPLNAGRQAHHQRSSAVGRVDLATQRMDLTLEGLPGINGPLELQISGEGALARSVNGQWQPIGNFEGIFAPGGDPLAFLAAASAVTPLEPVQRAGTTFQRYHFAVDGPRFARLLQARMQAELTRKGELPVGMQVDLPRAYAEMSGNGELWVDASGLPRRQILELRFPEHNRSLRSAHVQVDFTGFAAPAGGLWSQSPLSFNANIWSSLNTLTISSSLFLVTALLAYGIARAARSRPRHLAIVSATLIALLGGPVLQTGSVLAYSDRQGEQQREQQANEQVAAQAEQIAAAQAARAHEPTASPLQTAQRAVSTQQTALPAFDTTVCYSGHTAYATTATGNLDNDGLNDYEECLLGTDPFDADSDGDTVSDGNEVAGFLLGGVQWYGDPLNADSNNDGLADAVEWNLNQDSQATPDDSDGDATPDLFDFDNDGDGVPDRDDLSPFVNGATRVFSETSPLALSFADTAPNKYLYVEFQLRTTDPNHLRYSSTVLDWPEGDDEGQVQDIDGATFADVALAAGRDATPAEELGDMRLVPMLEISVPAGRQLLPSTEVLSNYNILLQNDPKGGKLAYLPLQSVSDRDSGELLAFSGKMIYLPTESWGADHKVRLVWLVQALVDECSERNAGGDCLAYAMNQSQVIFSYQDSWYLTGLNVREDHGANLAVIYEDPAVDNNKNEDDGLLGLLSVLDATFIIGSDCAATADGRNCAAGAGDGLRDLVVAKGDSNASNQTLFEAFDRTSSANNGDTTIEPWGIPNRLRVSTGSYAHRDEALYRNSSEVVPQLLANSFSSSAPVTPTLFFAREERARTLNLEEQGGSSLSWNNSRLSINLAAPPPGAASRKLETIAGLTVAAYSQDSFGIWEPLSAEAYRAELFRRYSDASVGDRQAKLFVVGALYQGLFNGFVNTVELDGRPALPNATALLRDAEIKQALERMYTSPGGQGVEFAANYVLDQFLAGDELLQSLRKLQAQEQLILLSDELDQLATQFKYQKAAQGLANTAKVVGAIGLGLAVVNVGVIIGLQFADGQAKTVLTYLNQALNLAVNAINLAVVAITTAQRVVQTAIEVGSLGQAARSVMGGVNVGKAAVAGAAVGLIVSLAITWGVFIDAVTSNNIDPGSPAFGYLIATAFAASLVAVLLFVLSLTTVGAIIVALIGLIDALLTIFGSKFTITGWLVENIAKAFYAYEYEPLVTISKSQLGELEVDLSNPALGLRADNRIVVGATISQTVEHIDPTALKEDSEIRRSLNNLVDPTSEQFTEQKIKDTVLNTVISATPGDEVTNWLVSFFKTVQYDKCDDGCGDEDLDLYKGLTVQKPTSGPIGLVAGVNVNPPATVVTRHKLPALECETIVGFPDCDSVSLDGYITSWLPLSFDIFPTNLDAFYALDWGKWSLFAPDYTQSGSVGNTRGGGELFPLHRDFDGDGLLARSVGGNDPDDRNWDADNDGVSDFREIELAEAGIRMLPDDLDGDSDNDGASDLLELRANTRPDRFDSDADGLGDAAEINGALFTYGTGKQSLVRSSPLRPDSDSDGLSDYSERQLHANNPARFPYNPNGVNSFPMALRTGVEGPAAVRDGGNTFVSAGASFVYLSALRNNLPADEFATGTLSVSLPSALGGSTAVYNLEYAGDTERTYRTNVTAGASASGVTTITNDLSALLRPQDTTPRSNLIVAREASQSLPANHTVIQKLALSTSPNWATPFTSAVLQEWPGDGERERGPDDLQAQLYRSNGSAIERIAVTQNGNPLEEVDELGDNLRQGVASVIAMACLNSGTCVMVYHKLAEDGSRNQGIETYRTTISASGVVGSPQLISIPNPYSEFQNPERNIRPAIATDGNAFMTAWLDTENSSDASALVVRPLDSNGNVPFQTGTTTAVERLTISGSGEIVRDFAIAALDTNTYRVAWVVQDGSALKQVTITNGVAGTTTSTAISNYSGGLDLAARTSDGVALATYRRSDSGVQALTLNSNTPCSVQLGAGTTATGASVAYSSAANTWLVGYSFNDGNGRLALVPLNDSCAQLVSTQTAALDAASISDSLDLACNATDCKAAIASTPGTLYHYSAELSSTPAPFAALAQQIPDRLTIDSDSPTASFDQARYYVPAGPGTLLLSGTASDPTSGVLRTTISANGGELGQADGREAWGFLYSYGDAAGVTTLAASASDLVGRTQANPASTLVIVDDSAPTVTLNQGENAFVSATYGAGDTFYRINLSGTASDPAISSEAGSGVAGVELRLHTGDWLPATLASDGTWQIDYPLPSYDSSGNRIIDPSGSYVVNIRSSDTLGNLSSDEAISRTLRVDLLPPVASLLSIGGAEPINVEVITRTSSLAGLVSENGSANSGIAGLEISLTDLETSFGTPNFAPVNLSTSGAEVLNASWNYTVPTDLEGFYQIDLRASDQQGNQENDSAAWGVWQGEIDTLAPRLSLTSTPTATGVILRLEATDRNLVASATSLAACGGAASVQREYYSSAWYNGNGGDPTRLYRVIISCTLPSEPAGLSVEVCDGYGNCGASSIGLAANSIESEACIDRHSTVGAAPCGRPQGASLPNPCNDAPCGQVRHLAPAEFGANLPLAAETTPPAATIATTAISTGLLLGERVQIRGTSSDPSGVASVRLRIGSGPWVEAQLTPQSNGSVNWLALWPLQGTLPANATVQARATDTLGNWRIVSRTLPADLQAPTEAALAPRYRNTAGNLQTLTPGATVRDATTLQLDWAAANDNRGVVGYRAGWIECDAGEIAQLRDCANNGGLLSYGAAVRSHSAPAPEPGLRYGVVLARDALGNESLSVAGPFFFDKPATPDLVGNLDYDGWQGNACAAVGVSYAVERRALPGAAVSEAQRLYASWDAMNLHMSWHGADWAVAGDLAIYLDSGPDGSNAGYEPEGRGPALGLPSGFGADYLVRVEDASDAKLYRWDGTAWAVVDGWPQGQFRLDTRNQPARTEIVLPWASLGDPASIGVIALALDEDSQAVWAALPSANPLNSARITGAEPAAGLALLRAFAWQRSAACPAELAASGLDLQASLESAPQGTSAAFFADDLGGRQSPGAALDADSDGNIDNQLGLAAGAVVGPGDAVSYTLRLVNTGEQSASGLVVGVETFGGLEVENPQSPIANLAPGQELIITINGQVVDNGSASAELLVTITDSTGATLEWLWNHHPLDQVAPEPPVVLLANNSVLLPGANIPVAASDPSGIASVNLAGGGGTCVQPTAGGELWLCPAPATTPSGGQVAAMATDTRGNSSATGPAVSIVIDGNAPTVAFAGSLATALADGVLTPSELLLGGTASDDSYVAAVQLCANAANAAKRCAETALEGRTTSTNWAVDLGLLAVDGEERTVQATARDGVGRLSAAATFSATIDTVGPLVLFTTAREGAFVGDSVAVLAGTISDGSGVGSLEIEIQRVGGFAERLPITPSGANWRFTVPNTATAGEYLLRAYASDIYGNRRAYGPFKLRLTDDPIIAEAGGPYGVEELQGLTLDGTGTRIRNGTLASAGWDITGDGVIDREGLTVSAVLFSVAGTYQVTLYATHSSGATSSDTATVTVFNREPTLDSITSNTPVEGSQFALDLVVNDPGDSQLYVSVDWGEGAGVERAGPFDGSGATSTIALRHSYRDNGNYPVIFTVSDSFGDTVSDEVTAVVSNALPVLTLGGAETIGEGETLRRSGSFSDAGLADTHTATVDYGDGAGPQPLLLRGQQFELEHQYLRDGNYEITVVVTDDDGGAVEGRFALLVENRGPEVEPGADLLLFEGETANLLVGFSDPGPGDQHTASVDWGDGQVSAGTVLSATRQVQASHLYSAPGRYNVVVTVTDESGASGSNGLLINVLPGLLRYCAYADGNRKYYDVLELRPDVVANCATVEVEGLAGPVASGIGARGGIELDQRSQVVGQIDSAQNRIRLERQARASGSLRAGDNVELEREALVNGSVTALRDVLLKRSVKVGGDVQAGNNVRREGGVTVGGTVRAFVPGLVAPPASSIIAPPVVPGGADVTIAPNGTLALAPGDYGALVAGPGAALTLQAGEYSFSSISMGSKSKLLLDLRDPNATLVVRVGGRLLLGNGHQSELALGGEASNVLFHVAGDRISLGGKGSYVGTFLGLAAEIRLNQQATLKGALYGRAIFLEAKARLEGDPALRLVGAIIGN
jgi:cytoskeletal protein CcmA (bactofilin family)